MFQFRTAFWQKCPKLHHHISNKFEFEADEKTFQISEHKYFNFFQYLTLIIQFFYKCTFLVCLNHFQASQVSPLLLLKSTLGQILEETEASGHTRL